MLVLSRRLNEKILFPGMKASVQIVEVKGGVVRLGIEAPPDVTIMREELQGLPPMHQPRPQPPTKPGSAGKAAGTDRVAHQCLEAASVGLGLARLQLQAGLAGEAEATLERLHEEIQQLRQRLPGSRGQRRRPAPAESVEETRHESMACCLQ